MKLYYFETSNPRKACAVARHVDADVELVRVDLGQREQLSDEFLAINPNAKVPALTDGDVKLFESTAIMAYLAHKAGSDLWPSDPLRQVEILKWIAWDLTHFSRHGSALFFENLVKPRFNLGEPDPEAIREASEFFVRFAGVLNDHLATSEYVAGDQLTIADFAVANLLPYAEPAKLPLEGQDHIVRWHDQLLELPAWAEPFPTSP